jgi:predicted RNA-binding Zn-ribbon protein involved in translation (DUF1610 family)
MSEQSMASTEPTNAAAGSGGGASTAHLCPYCGERQAGRERCETCRGLFEPLSRQATQNAMGPWYVRDAERPFQPGCSYETLVGMLRRGRVQPSTVLRGPTTSQFWCEARHTPGVGHLFGRCHSCDHGVSPSDTMCPKCGASFASPRDRQDLGLGPVQELPGRTAPVARASARPKTPMRPTKPAGPRPGAKPDDAAAALRAMAGGPARAVQPGVAPVAHARASAPMRPEAHQAATDEAPQLRRRVRRLSGMVTTLIVTQFVVLAVAIAAAVVFRTELAAFLGGERETTLAGGSDEGPAQDLTAMEAARHREALALEQTGGEADLVRALAMLEQIAAEDGARERLPTLPDDLTRLRAAVEKLGITDGGE